MLLRFLRGVYCWTCVTITISFFSSLVFIFLPIDFLNRKSRWAEGHRNGFGTCIKMAWFRLILRLFQIKIILSGPGAKDAKKMRGVIYVANHQSILDILVISQIVSEDAAFVAKKELSRIPIFGWAARAVGTLFIDRSKGRRNRSLNEIDVLIQKGASVIMFPEGTRSAHGEVLAFKRGAFVMAIQNQIAVVPITIENSGRLCPKKSLVVLPGTIRVHVGSPISAKGLQLEQKSEFTDQIRSLIAKQLSSMRQSA